ncbi:hypothetical protein SOMG_04244 [Schizosaccharomyces osmophilus]|uniref:Uncharacterized protein n=1 Tax=Schizosaccharomyces osmophilus TaxID=2545709 RepID=A0AAE9WGM8_9SCHI|nr:uncharacterized protein SOMG_04244 [Schizosaccharomyces osmophilus]WBW74676.1 hypothetical protein SOMG_04244 [Schizosaccharomyces osmophilus]
MEMFNKLLIINRINVKQAAITLNSEIVKFLTDIGYSTAFYLFFNSCRLQKRICNSSSEVLQLGTSLPLSLTTLNQEKKTE